MLVGHMEDTILYKSSCIDIYPIYLGDSKKTCGIKWKLHNSDGFVHLFTVYMPCDVNIAMYHRGVARGGGGVHMSPGAKVQGRQNEAYKTFTRVKTIVDYVNYL